MINVIRASTTDSETIDMEYFFAIALALFRSSI